MQSELVPVLTQEQCTFLCIPQALAPNQRSLEGWTFTSSVPSARLSFSMHRLTKQWLQNLYVVFSWRVCSGHHRQRIFHLHHMHVVGKKGHASIQRSILFLGMSVTRSCRTKALQCYLWLGTFLFILSFQLTTCIPCNAHLLPSLSHFSGQSAQTAPWMFGFCKLQKFYNLSFITHQATYNNWQWNKFDIPNEALQLSHNQWG